MEFVNYWAAFALGFGVASVIYAIIFFKEVQVAVAAKIINERDKDNPIKALMTGEERVFECETCGQVQMLPLSGPYIAGNTCCLPNMIKSEKASRKERE